MAHASEAELERRELLRRAFWGAAGVAGASVAVSAGAVRGLPIARPDLHFFYNVVETMPLIAGFVYQLRRTHDTWLARAFPRLAPDALRRVTAAARSRRFGRGEEIVSEGDLPRSCFVIARGEVEVSRT